MRDYWLTQELLKLTGWGYVALCVIALLVAIKLPKSGWGKAIAAAVVIGLASILPLQAKKEIDQSQVKADEFKVRYAKAKALFDERCKTAGEKIYKTVEGVEGIFLMNLRPEKVNSSDQFARYDPYGYEGGGEDYIKSLLAGHWKTCVGANPTCSDQKRAFEYVETVQSGSFRKFHSIDRATQKPFEPGALSIPQLVPSITDKPRSLYGVEWRDISTDQDRENWIAGGQITVIDLSTKQPIAQRIGYYMDSGLGSTTGQRSPWSWARLHTKGCPSVEEHNFVFIRKVLKSNSGK